MFLRDSFVELGEGKALSCGLLCTDECSGICSSPAFESQEGIFADFSSTSVPQVPAYSLGLAQIEEIQKKIRELKEGRNVVVFHANGMSLPR